MVNIDLLTLGSEFKDNDGFMWKVSANFAEGDKIHLELTKVGNQELKEILELEPD